MAATVPDKKEMSEVVDYMMKVLSAQASAAKHTNLHEWLDKTYQSTDDKRGLKHKFEAVFAKLDEMDATVLSEGSEIHWTKLPDRIQKHRLRDALPMSTVTFPAALDPELLLE